MSERAALLAIEQIAHRHRQNSIEAFHTDDGNLNRDAMDDALKWEAVLSIIRAVVPHPAVRLDPFSTPCTQEDTTHE